MRIAYLIMLHQRPEQALRLLRAIHRPEHLYVLHVDRRADPSVAAGIDEGIRELANASRIASRICTYAGWGMVETQLVGMRAALEAARPWDFFVNLSAQDYPLRSQEAIADELRPYAGRSLLDFGDQANWPESLSRLRFHVDVHGHLLRLGRTPRRLPQGNRPAAGGQWVTLSRGAVEYLTGASPAVRRLRRFYRFTAQPDEGFVQTALVNSPLRPTLVNGARRFVEFDGDRPRTLTTDDVAHLLESDALFARKFAPVAEPGALAARTGARGLA